jgi:hypothetical protein
MKFTWPELLQLYKTKPNISEHELLEMKGYLGLAASSTTTNELDSGLGTSMESSIVATKGGKSKGGNKKKKDKNKTNATSGTGTSKREKETRSDAAIRNKTDSPGYLLYISYMYLIF